MVSREPGMMEGHRWVRTGFGFVLIGALLAGCTSKSGSAGPTSADLTAGGTAYSLPSSPLPEAPSAPPSGPIASISAGAPPAPSSSPAPTSVAPSSSVALSASALPSTSTSKPKGSAAATLQSPTKPPAVSSVGLPTVSGGALSAQEVKDRAAIEAVWVEYWKVINRIVRTQSAKRQQLLETVSIDPQASAIITDAATFEQKGWDNYGIPGHAVYWGPAINAKSPAIMGDCMDFSHVGRLVAKTSEQLTVGKPKQNLRGVFTKNTRGEWRVSNVEFLKGTGC
jgi:hypothetical protein